MHTRIPLYKKLLSYLYPVPIRRSAGSENEYLELNLYCNQLQLASRCYQAIFDTGVFRPAPPIFFYFDPVASVGSGGVVESEPTKRFF